MLACLLGKVRWASDRFLLKNLQHMARSLLLSLSLSPSLCLARLLVSNLRRPPSGQQKSKSNLSFGWISPAGLSPSSSPSQYTAWLCNEQPNDGTRKCVRLKVLRVSILLMFGTSLLQATQTLVTRKGRMRKRWLQGMTCWLACSAKSDGLATDSSLKIFNTWRVLSFSLSLSPSLCLARLLVSNLRRPPSGQQKSKSNLSFGWISPAGLSPSSSPSQYTTWLCNEQPNDGTRKCVRLKVLRVSILLMFGTSLLQATQTLVTRKGRMRKRWLQGMTCWLACSAKSDGLATDSSLKIFNTWRVLSFSLSLSLPPSVLRGFWCQICADLPVANKKAKAISPLDGFLRRDCRRPLPQANTQRGCATNNRMMALASVFDSKSSALASC